jgi:hypothetical protein
LLHVPLDNGHVPLGNGRSGAPSAAKQVGQVPANYTEGQGTIVSGATADQATGAALLAYPGVLVDRVVLLSSAGDYEVHSARASGAKTPVEFQKNCWSPPLSTSPLQA